MSDKPSIKIEKITEGKKVIVEEQVFEVPDDIPFTLWELMLRLSMERDHYKEKYEEIMGKDNDEDDW